MTIFVHFFDDFSEVHDDFSKIFDDFSKVYDDFALIQVFGDYIPLIKASHTKHSIEPIYVHSIDRIKTSVVLYASDIQFK